MIKDKVINLPMSCRNFPKNPISEVSRENLLDTIDRTFKNDVLLQIIEGNDGIGKTTLLAQYAKRYADCALSLFIKPFSRLSFSPKYLMEILCEQINCILPKSQVNSDSINDLLLRNQISKLQKYALKNKKVFYFVIDGLHDLPQENIRIQNIILEEILPIGLDAFRFLLSGDLRKLPNNIQKAVFCKPFQLPSFSLDETKRFLKNLEIEHDDLNDIHNMCQGIPEHLASVRRLLKSGTNIKNILNEDPDKLPDFLNIEWKKIKEASHEQKIVLALIAFGHISYTTEEISRILNLDLSKVENSIQNFTILTVDNETKYIDFVSELMRKFASNQLQEIKEDIINFLIDDSLKNTDSERTLYFLPGYYEQAGRFNELLEYLTPEYFSKILERSQSLYPVHQKAEMGLLASQKLNQDKELIRFSMQKSVITELEKAEVWRSEIEALMALRNYSAALTLVNSTVLKEDKLHLLTTIARIKCEEGIALEPELKEEIEFLYKQIDHKYLGKRATEIASNLIWFNPDLAIKLIDTFINIQEDKEEQDWAFAKLSISALAANYKESLPSAIAEQVQSRIRDPELHKFTQSLSIFFGEFSASELIERAEKLELKNRLFFIKKWVILNKDKEKADDVIEYALDILIKNTPYTPKIRDLYEIATPLPYVSDKKRTKELLGRFDSLKGTIENLGTSVDYVSLQLLLALTESKHDFKATSNRVLEIYYYVEDIEELTTKTECLALMISKFSEIDTKGILEENEGILSMITKELNLNVTELLNTTAYHYIATKGIIKALSTSEFNIAIKIAQSLNTSICRDLATVESIKTMIERPFKENDFSLILEAIERIEDLDYKDETLKDTIEQLDHAWEAIDTGWMKINVGFQITKAFAKISSEIANKYLKLTEQVKNEISINAEKPTLSFIACLKLAIRAFGGLLPTNINTLIDVERLTRLIDVIPSNVEKAGLWGDIALIYFMNNHSDEGKKVVLNYLKSVIINISDDDDKYRVITNVAPALYFAHKQSAIEMIQKIPNYKHDEALSKICDFIFKKVLTSDPYEILRGHGFNLTYEEVLDICSLLDLMSTDCIIYGYIEDISNSFFFKPNKFNFTEQQKVDITDRIDKIISKKLPDQKNIQHDGFKIVSLAQIARIKRESPPFWCDLIESARKIPNTADVAYVLCIISTLLPSKLSSKGDKIVEEAINLIKSINSDLDKTQRFKAIAEILSFKNENISRKCLKLGIETSLRLNETDLIYPAQRRIIDLAHKIEPSFAESLVDLIDNDPARRVAKNEDLMRHLEILNLKKNMSEQKDLDPNIKMPKLKSMYPKAAWMNLGALNGGRIAAIHFKYLIPYIISAAEIPLSESYPILAWAIENIVKRVAGSNQASSYIIPIFEATLLGAELASYIAIRSSEQLKQIKQQKLESFTTKKSIIIRSRERDKAIRFIKEWFAQEAQEYLIICDPYFGIEDLEILKILMSISPKCTIKILTSKKHQQKQKLPQPWCETYQSYWHSISDQNPPETEIIFIGLESSGESPIHDRFWLTQTGGLRVGTSFNSLGINKISEISILSLEESNLMKNEINQYINRIKKDYKNEKLTYNLFLL